MRRASRSHGIAGRLRLLDAGSAAKSPAAIAGWSRGSLRKYQAQATTQKRLANPRITNERRQVTKSSSPAISGGVSAFPILPKECVMPCEKPQARAGIQVDMARVAVGKAAP